VAAWQVVSENRTLGQFEALRSGATPLVGRDEEMDLLLRRWAQAKAGNGRVVLISTEPGGGKSRLARPRREGRRADEGSGQEALTPLERPVVAVAAHTRGLRPRACSTNRRLIAR
jgi:hypothetical protein